MALLGIHPPEAVGTAPARALWSEPEPSADEAPEATFAALFGDADRVRIGLWIDRTAPTHGGLFCADTCAAELDLAERDVRDALGPLQHIGMVAYRGGLYMRCEHQLWVVLKVFRSFAGSAPARPASGSEARTPPQDLRTANFYFG